MKEVDTPLQLVNKYTIEHFNTDQVKGQIKNRMLFVTLGEEDHRIPISKVAGLVTDIYEKDGVIHGKWKVLSTPSGTIIDNLLSLDGEVKIRPVGVGTVKDGVVQDDYKLLYFSLDAA